MNTESSRAILGGGCFWGIEHLFLETPGVLNTQVGYSGGHLDSPTYEDICRGDSGHAEVVEIKYDSEKISYKEILDLFFRMHDPTTLNRQGVDLGTQYRSVIFYTSLEQKNEAEAFIKNLTERNVFSRPIVTELTQEQKFWPAEDYHQKYFLKNPSRQVCHFLRGEL